MRTLALTQVSIDLSLNIYRNEDGNVQFLAIPLLSLTTIVFLWWQLRRFLSVAWWQLQSDCRTICNWLGVVVKVIVIVVESLAFGLCSCSNCSSCRGAIS